VSAKIPPFSTAVGGGGGGGGGGGALPDATATVDIAPVTADTVVPLKLPISQSQLPPPTTAQTTAKRSVERCRQTLATAMTTLGRKTTTESQTTMDLSTPPRQPLGAAAVENYRNAEQRYGQPLYEQSISLAAL
jgi:hypothetical protein